MKLLRLFRWYDADKHAHVAQELAAAERDIVDMAARLEMIEAEVYPFGRSRIDYPGSGRPL